MNAFFPEARCASVGPGILSACFSILAVVLLPPALALAQASPLHVDGAFLKDPSGRVVVLRGVNHHGFLDAPDGAWDAPGRPLYSGMGRWDPGVVQETLDDFHRRGFNVVRFHTVAEWWKTDPASYRDPYRSVVYPESYRRMMEDVVKWAGERGLYVVFDFFAMKNVDGRQSGQESLPWPPWGRFPDVVKDRAAFVSLWASVAADLGRFPNVLFELYNEPHGDAAAEAEWFKFVDEVLPAIRSHSANPVIVQWGYDCWVNLDYPPPDHPASTLDWIERHPLKDANVVYGAHLYRNSGGGAPGLAHRGVSPVENLWDLGDLRRALELALFPKIVKADHKPVLVTEIGADLAQGGADAAHEVEWLKNALAILKGWGVGYVGWAWQSDEQLDHGMLHDGRPNAAGRVFLDSLKN